MEQCRLPLRLDLELPLVVLLLAFRHIRRMMTPDSRDPFRVAPLMTHCSTTSMLWHYLGRHIHDHLSCTLKKIRFYKEMERYCGLTFTRWVSLIALDQSKLLLGYEHYLLTLTRLARHV